MLVFIIKRCLQLIPVLIGVTLAVFLMLHAIPGDPARIMAGEAASEAQLEQMRYNLGLNDPLWVQYTRYLSNALQGDLGRSIRTNREVVAEIFDQRFWTTMQLATVGTGLAVLFGLTAGVVAAVYKRSLTDVGLMLIALLGLSMPNFWLGILLINHFSVRLGLLPTAGWGTPAHMVLPAVTLGVTGMAIIARMTRTSLTEVLNQDYIRTAYAKGTRDRVVIYKHALRNALVPVITVVGLQFGTLLGGAVVTETVFAINGMGRLILDSIRAQDFPMVQGTVLVVALVFVVVNTMVDITYRFANKRIDLG